jgi:hypothetical protein
VRISRRCVFFLVCCLLIEGVRSRVSGFRGFEARNCIKTSPHHHLKKRTRRGRLGELVARSPIGRKPETNPRLGWFQPESQPPLYILRRSRPKLSRSSTILYPYTYTYTRRKTYIHWKRRDRGWGVDLLNKPQEGSTRKPCGKQNEGLEEKKSRSHEAGMA